MKIGNDYARCLDRLYADMPKAVLAAVAVSFASHGGDDLAGAKAAILAEWKVLHANGIVPQKPPASEVKEVPHGRDQ